MQQQPEPERVTPENRRVRVVASNLTSGDNQSYEVAGISILQTLKADVALMQEFRYQGGERALVDEAFGSEFSYVIEAESLPNGVVSRFPIAASGSWDDPESPNRGFTYAQIDVPGDADLWAISVHLLTVDAATRNAEAVALLDLIAAAIPQDALIVLGGDFNTSSRTEACIETFSALFDTDGPFPADSSGNSNTNASRGKPYDWLLSSHTLVDYEVPVELNGDTYPNGLVYDDGIHSDVDGMQHMAVVKDYLF